MDTYRRFAGIDLPAPAIAAQKRYLEAESELIAVNNSLMRVNAELLQRTANLRDSLDSTIYPSANCQAQLSAIVSAGSQFSIANVIEILSQLGTSKETKLTELLQQLYALSSASQINEIKALTMRALNMSAFDVHSFTTAVSASKENLATRKGILREIEMIIPTECDFARLLALLDELLNGLGICSTNDKSQHLGLLIEQCKVAYYSCSIFNTEGTVRELARKHTEELNLAARAIKAIQLPDTLLSIEQTLKLGGDVLEFVNGGPCPSVVGAHEHTLFELICDSVENGERVMYYWRKCGMV